MFFKPLRRVAANRSECRVIQQCKAIDALAVLPAMTGQEEAAHSLLTHCVPSRICSFLAAPLQHWDNKFCSFEAWH